MCVPRETGGLLGFFFSITFIIILYNDWFAAEEMNTDQVMNDNQIDKQ